MFLSDTPLGNDFLLSCGEWISRELPAVSSFGLHLNCEELPHLKPHISWVICIWWLSKIWNIQAWPFCIDAGHSKAVQPVWNTACQFLIKLNLHLQYGPEIPLMGFYPREMKIYIPTKTCTHMFRAGLFIIAVNWKKIQMSLNGGTSLWWNTAQQFKGMNHWYKQKFAWISRASC